MRRAEVEPGKCSRGTACCRGSCSQQGDKGSCHRDSGSSTFAKNLSTSPQMPGSLVLMEMHGLPFVSWKDKCVRTRSEVVACS